MRQLGADRAALWVDDLADPAAPGRLVDAALRAFGKLDGLVNNAALVRRSDLHSTTVELFDAFMTINVRAPLLLIQAAHKHLVASHGAVLNIGSINGYCGESNLLGYSMSKGALITLTRNLADVNAGQIRINHFNVGWVLTPNEYDYKLADGLPADWPDQLGPPAAPNRRLFKPEEIAAASVYWLSDESIMVTGSIIDLEQYPVFGRNPVKAGDD